MSKAINQHDRFFKQVFSHKEEMQDFIIHSFPIEIVNNIDFATLKPDTNTYISNELQETFSDLVYTCNYQSAYEIKIALLFEHKSKKEEYPHFQLLKYISGIWDKCLKDGMLPIVVIPIVFYRGTQEYNYQQLHEYFGKIDETLKKYIPNFDYILIDTRYLTDQQILKLYEQKTLQIALFLFKYIFDQNQLQQKTKLIFANVNELIENQHGISLFHTIITYLSNLLKPESMELIAERIKEITPEGGEVFETYAEYLDRRGREKGMKEGMEKGMEKGMENEQKKMVKNCLKRDMSIIEISEITDLSVNRIKELIKLIESENV